MLKIYWRRPLTRLELAIYAGLVGIAAVFLAGRMLDYLELAERSAMEMTVARVNSAINVQLASEMLGGHLIYVKPALRRNPFELAKMHQSNYLGELDDPDFSTLERGNWVFDRRRAELVYLPRMQNGLKTPADGAIRFQLVRRGAFTYMLVPTSDYVWR